MAGAVTSSFTLPFGYRGGLAYANTLIWVPGIPSPGSSYVIGKFDPASPAPNLVGTVPGYRGTGGIELLCEGGGYLWLFNSALNPGDSKGMHKFDKTGVEVDFFPLDSWGAGITWANNYIWIPMAPARIDAYDFN